MLARLLFAFAIAGVLLAPAQTPAPPPLTAADAEKLEAALESNPDDPGARSRLLTYYFRAGATAAERVRPMRRKHIVWLIEHHPDAAVLGQSAATIDRAGHALADPDGYVMAESAWHAQFAREAPAAIVFANAIHFFKTADPAYARKLADDGLKRYPGDLKIGMETGSLDALAILGGKLMDNFGGVTVFDDAIASSETAKQARRELDTTSNPNILGGAGSLFSSQQIRLHINNMAGKAPDTGELARRCFERAIELDPENSRWRSGLRNVFVSAAAVSPKPAEKVALLEKAAGLPGTEIERWYVLSDLARARLEAGDTDKAAQTAAELLRLAGSYPKDWNYGNAIHHGNIVLGRVALKRGDTREARAKLIAAGKTPGSPQLNSFGPDWKLAEELLGKGEHEAVSEYIDLCRKFWKMDNGRLDAWSKAVASGGSPNFALPPGVKTPEMIGKPAPEFRLPDLNGRPLALADFKGKVVLLDFWATWCAPCRREMPEFEKLHREIAGKDAAILAIDIGEPHDTVAEYINKEKYTFPVLLGEGSEIAKLYGVNVYPSLVAIDKDGRVASYTVGLRSDLDLHDVIERARAGAPASSDPGFAAPKLLSPEPAAVFDHYPRQTTLVWAAVPGAAGYRVEVDYFAAGVWNTEQRPRPIAFRVTEPVYSFQFYGAQPGRWRVWAVDASGREGAKSDWREFRFTK